MTRPRTRIVAALAVFVGLVACSRSEAPDPVTPTGAAASSKAVCGPGSHPEIGLQGRVSGAEHESGRATEGYRCNVEVVGTHTIPDAIGTVAGFKVERYVDAAGHDCAYYDTTLTFPTNLVDGEAGVNVLDMSDPANPVLTERLLTVAMLSPPGARSRVLCWPASADEAYGWRSSSFMPAWRASRVMSARTRNTSKFPLARRTKCEVRRSAALE
mgnify:CR=1 FL=1